MPTDPALASRLKELIERLEAGQTFDEAVDAAGVTRSQARELFSSIKRSLVSGEEPKRAKRATRARPKSGIGPIVAYSDGASRGNPGPAACAAILYAGKDELLRRTRRLGKATNNVAEYEGAVLALELCGQLRARAVTLRVDSELVVKQIQGSYKVKHPSLKPYHQRVLQMAAGFESFTIEHVGRDDNADADRLVNDALDGKAEE